jgi:uncharacterized protein (TIGR00288 family)
MSDEPNIALLIDADNASPDHLDEVLLVLGELGTINIRRAYGNWQKPALKGWGNLTMEHSILPVQQFDVVKGKSATDMRMVIDAMDLLHRERVQGFGIMSSDSDFLPLVQRIRENGIIVYGFGTQKAPISFQNACHRFIHLDRPPETISEHEATQEPAADGEVDPQLIILLGEAWKASKRNADGYASLGEIGQRAKQVSSFSVRNYGFRSLSDLIRSLPEFEVKETSGAGLLAKRLR